MDLNIKSSERLSVYYSCDFYDSECDDNSVTTILSDDQMQDLQRSSAVGDDGIRYLGKNLRINHSGAISIEICLLVDADINDLKGSILPMGDIKNGKFVKH